jgi:hypothetical protein
MKKLSILLIGLMLLVLAGPTLAAKPGAKTIRHCGCVLDAYGVTGVGMVYHDIEVAGKSGGHKRHLIGTYDDCATGVFELEEPFAEITEEWLRSGADCEVTDLDDNIVQCPDEEPFILEEDVCGSKVIDPS